MLFYNAFLCVFFCVLNSVTFYTSVTIYFTLVATWPALYNYFKLFPFKCIFVLLVTKYYWVKFSLRLVHTRICMIILGRFVATISPRLIDSVWKMCVNILNMDICHHTVLFLSYVKPPVLKGILVSRQSSSGESV